MRPGILISLLVCAFVAACGSPAATGAPGTAGTQPSSVSGQASPAPAQPTPTPPAANVGGAGTSIAHLEVASGPQAGTYDETGPKVDCNIASDGGGATFQDLAATEGLSGLTFIAGEGGASVTKVYFQAFFGAIGGPYLEIVTLDPASKRGDATARLADKGNTIKWSIEGTTGEGVAIKATIECGPVDRR